MGFIKFESIFFHVGKPILLKLTEIPMKMEKENGN